MEGALFEVAFLLVPRLVITCSLPGLTRDAAISDSLNIAWSLAMSDRAAMSDRFWLSYFPMIYRFYAHWEIIVKRDSQALVRGYE